MIRAAARSSGEGSSGLTAAINATDAPAVYQELAALLGDEPERVRIFAASALGNAGNPETLETLEPLLRDKSPIVRLRAVEAVADYGAVDDMVPALAQLIADDPDPQVPRLAVHALFIVRDTPQAAAALRVATADVDPDIRAAAQKMMAQRS